MSDGFVRGLDKPRRTGQSAYEGLEALVTAAAGRGAEVFLTGHSLGGATAVVFAQLLATRSACCLFGARGTDCMTNGSMQSAALMASHPFTQGQLQKACNADIIKAVTAGSRAWQLQLLVYSRTARHVSVTRPVWRPLSRRTVGVSFATFMHPT